MDDRAANRKLLNVLLTRAGHRVLEAADGADALLLARSERPQVVISDILMPTMDGFEFVRRLRSDPEIAQTEVIFHTAYFHEREVRDLIEACGVSRVLIKPCAPGRVLHEVEEALTKASRQVAPSNEPEFQKVHLRVLYDKLAQTAGELEVANRRLVSLNEANLQMTSQRDPGKLLKSACRDARDLIGARYAILCVRDEAKRHSTFCTSSGFSAQSAAELLDPRVDDPLFASVTGQNRALRIKTRDGDTQVAGMPSGFAAVESLLAVPVASPDGNHGWLCLLNKVGLDEFDERDERLLTELGSQVGRVLEDGNMFQEMKRSTEKLRESELRFRQLADHIQAVFFLIDAGTGQVLYVSPAYAEVWGQSIESLYANPMAWAEPIVAEDRARAIAEQSVDGVFRGFETEYRILRPDGKVRWIRSRGFPVSDVTGRAHRVAGIAEDITDRMRLENSLRHSESNLRHANTDLERRVVERTAELEAANKELETFNYSVSHDLRAPLGRIQGFAALLGEQYGASLDARGRELLTRITEAQRVMVQLVDDLFALSNATGGKLTRNAVDVSAVAESIVKNLRISDPTREVHVEIKAGMTAWADRGLVRVVLENLLGNAWKFTKGRENARIEVGCPDKGDESVFSVNDNGAGFDSAGADLLFSPFQRLHSRKDFEGSGIGLATVQRIVRRHGGRVWAESKVGRGATFFFTLSGDMRKVAERRAIARRLVPGGSPLGRIGPVSFPSGEPAAGGHGDGTPGMPIGDGAGPPG